MRGYTRNALQTLLIGKNPKRTLIRGLGLGIFCYFIFRYALSPVWTSGSSMEPRYQNASFTFINRLAYLHGSPQRGDIVAIALPTGESYMYLKRVVGLPGEKIEIRKGMVHINDVLLNEDYVRWREPWELPKTKIAEGEYFVIGDNRGHSMSQHRFGRINRRLIAGKVVF